MSWSASFASRERFDKNEPKDAYPSDLPDEVREQITAAREAAADIIASGAIGDKDVDVLVSLYGHANAGHTQESGQANESITVVVSRVT